MCSPRRRHRRASPAKMPGGTLLVVSFFLARRLSGCPSRNQQAQLQLAEVAGIQRLLQVELVDPGPAELPAVVVMDVDLQLVWAG